MAGTELEAYVSQTNAEFFLREFAFSSTKFAPAAHHVVCFDDNLLVYQVKGG